MAVLFVYFIHRTTHKAILNYNSIQMGFRGKSFDLCQSVFHFKYNLFILSKFEV